MVTTQQLLDALRQIGLNLYERKLWVALLSRGTSTAGELSSLAKVPHSRTYDILESLAEKGFVVVQTTKPLKYVAIQPNEALERAKKKLKEDLDIMVERISDFQKSQFLKELEKIYKHGVELVRPGEFTGALKGRHAMHQQLETIFKNAKTKISILTTAQGLNDLHERHGELLNKIAKKGIKIRIATPISKDAIPLIDKFKGIAEIRKIEKSILGRFCVVDDNQIVLALTDDKEVHPTQDMAFWTQSEHVAGDVLGPMFDAIWQQLPQA